MRLAALAIAALAVACDSEPPPQVAEQSPDSVVGAPVSPTWDDTARATRWTTFDPPTLRVGDTVGGLVVTIARIAHHAELGVYHGTVQFRGPIELAGHTRRHPDSDIKTVCFEADTATGRHLPRFPDDLRRPWFCFTDDDYAAEHLGPRGSSRPARIVIDDFVNVKGFSDETNSARLVRVLSR